MSQTEICEKIILGYFSVRAYVDHLKLLLEYKQIPYTFQSCQKEQLDDGSWQGGLWYQEWRHNLNLDFPNMPFYIEKYSDGSQFSMTESMAILRHLGRKYSLYGDGSIQHMAKVDMLVDVAVELRLIFVNLTYFGDVEKEKSDYFKKTGDKFSRFETFMVNHGADWVCGHRITIADFILWTVLDYNVTLYPDILDPYPNLRAVKSRMESVTQVAEYLNSERFSRFPINSPYANWGGQKK